MSFLKNHIDKLYFGFCVTLVLVMFFYIFESQVTKNPAPTFLYGDTVRVEKQFHTGMLIIPYGERFASSPCKKEDISLIATDSILVLVDSKDTIKFRVEGVNPNDNSELFVIGKAGLPVVFKHVYLRDTTENYLLIASPQPPYILLGQDKECFTLPDRMSVKPDSLSLTPQIRL